jgi:peptidoglycan/LPS O-acetylase OafA/YrhL
LLLRTVSMFTQDRYSPYLSATHLRMDALLIGVALRALAQHRAQLFLAFRQWRAGLIAFGIVCWIQHCFIPPETTFIRTIGLTATSFGSAAFILAAYHTRAADFGTWARFVSPIAAVFGWVGVYSYTIYLWHVTAIRILEREFAGRLISSIGNGAGTYIASIVVVSSGAVLAGVVAAKVVELPLLRLRDRFFPSRARVLPITLSAERSADSTPTKVTFTQPPVHSLPLVGKQADLPETAAI